MVVLGLRCCLQVFSGCGEQGLLIAVVSLVAEHRLYSAWASVAMAHELFCVCHGMWDLPGPEIELGSPALADQFLPLDHQGSVPIH